MEFFKESNINFSGKFTMFSILSGILVLACIYGAVFKLKYGVDFSGGAEIQVKFQNGVELGTLRKTLEESGYGGVQVQSLGEVSDNEYLVKVQASDESVNKIGQDIAVLLTTKFSSEGAEVRKTDIVGPKAGARLKTQGFLAMFWALVAIMIYVGLRFDFRYSPGVIIAVLHDALVIIGLYAFTGSEFTLQTVAAILAIIGYSVNDTVVIFDRVREHEAKYSGVALKNLIDKALNETLSRTILTSAATLSVAIIMFFFGGPAIQDFFMALTVGIISGSYSTLFIASPVTLLFDKWYGKNRKSNAVVA